MSLAWLIRKDILALIYYNLYHDKYTKKNMFDPGELNFVSTHLNCLRKAIQMSRNKVYFLKDLPPQLTQLLQ